MKTHTYTRLQTNFGEYADEDIFSIRSFRDTETKSKKFKISDCIKIIEVTLEAGWSQKYRYTGKEVHYIVIATQKQIRMDDLYNNMKIIKVKEVADE